jgi:hypothetical protein
VNEIMKSIITSIEAEYQRYKALADAATAQLSDEELSAPASGDGNSVAVVAWHIAGNLTSRFTDFLTTDGEKSWRRRDEEFAPRTPTRQELSDHWENGWGILFSSLSELNDEHLEQSIVIRGTELRVHEALHRSLAHVSYHVGQIVYAAKGLRGQDWEYLSVPPGGSGAYNRSPTNEHATTHTAKLKSRIDKT